ncbi:MAG: tetratricopeptide repeat protein [Pseudomonadota bacterium]
MRAKDLANKAYRAGRDAMAQGDHETARAALRWARRADSGNPLYIHAEAVLAHKTGGYFEADRLYRRVADLAERTFGEGHIRNVAISAKMIALYEEMGNAHEAEKLRHRVVDGLDRKSAADSSIHALDRLAEICLRAGRSADALAIYEAALARRRQAFGDVHERVSECLVALTRLRVRVRGLAEAAAARKALPAFEPKIVWRREEEAHSALSA